LVTTTRRLTALSGSGSESACCKGTTWCAVHPGHAPRLSGRWAWIHSLEVGQHGTRSFDMAARVTLQRAGLRQKRKGDQEGGEAAHGVRLSARRGRALISGSP
jgi:hypothetical protein